MNSRRIVFSFVMAGLATMSIGCGEEGAPAASGKEAPSGPAASGKSPAGPDAPASSAKTSAVPASDPVAPDPAFFEKLKLCHGVSLDLSGMPYELIETVDGKETRRIGEGAGRSHDRPTGHSPYKGNSVPRFDGCAFTYESDFTQGKHDEIKVRIRAKGELSPDGRTLRRIELSEVVEKVEYDGKTKSLGQVKTRSRFSATVVDLPRAAMKFSGFFPQVEYEIKGSEASAHVKAFETQEELLSSKTVKSLGVAKSKDELPAGVRMGKPGIRVRFWYPTKFFEKK